MFSKDSLKYFSNKNKIIYKKFKKKPNFKEFLNLVKKGITPLPQYGLPLLLAAKQAKDLGIKKIKIIELGCENFGGLIDIENYVSDIQRFLDIEVEIFGFTLKEGLPKYKPNNYDRLYRWQPGDYKLKKENYFNKLRSSKVYFGDIKKTIPKFLKDYKKTFTNSPLGLIFFDLDYYSSTKIGLDLLKLTSVNYLPRTYLHFDDHSFSGFDEGERKAIYEFNKISKYKISNIEELAEQLSIFFNKWIFLGKRIKVINYFNNKNYNKRVTSILG
jgi:hypothetical protein